MVDRICSGSNCDRLARTRGMCQKHYVRFWKHGTTDDPTPHVQRACSHQDCERPSAGLGLCKMHYKREWRKKNPTRVRPTREEFFWSKVEKSARCWIWSGQTNLQGYAVIGNTQAQRFSYELLVGPIPEGMWVDHRCHNPLCVNPEHLRPVTPAQNGQNLRGAKNSSKSGVRGVSWDKEKQKWVVFVGHNYRKYNGGRYDSIEDAERAAIALRNRLHTHNDVDRGTAIR